MCETAHPLDTEGASSMRTQPTELDIAWAAGLFEGEGCWSTYIRESGKVQMQARLGTSDRDVVERFASIVGCGAIHARKPGTRGHKPIHDWCVYEAEKVRQVIALLLPHMGQRRRAKAEETLKVGIDVQSHNAKKMLCPKDHPLSGDNLVLEPFTAKNGKTYIARRCRICRTEQGRSRARVEKGITPDRYRKE